MKRFIGLNVPDVVEICALDESGKRLFQRRIGCTWVTLLGLAAELS